MRTRLVRLERSPDQSSIQTCTPAISGKNGAHSNPTEKPWTWCGRPRGLQTSPPQMGRLKILSARWQKKGILTE